MQDLCDIVGVEYNSEAQARLEGALRGKMRGLDLDHEADCVVVHARGVKALTTALVALDSVAASRPLWSQEAFDRAVAAMSAWRRPRPLPYDVGAVVAVPLKEYDPKGRFGAALVATFESALWADPPKGDASGALRCCGSLISPLRRSPSFGTTSWRGSASPWVAASCSTARSRLASGP